MHCLFIYQTTMKEHRGYIPPPYIPLGQSDREESDLEKRILSDVSPTKSEPVNDAAEAPLLWSSGICACFDDLESCCIGTICPCYLFGKNAEYLGSNTFMGSCTTHFIICGLINSCCCLLTGGLLLGFPGCFAACYACGYRKALRTKYNLQEAPCGDFITHLCCHMCAVCQEYREIRERSVNINPNASMVETTAPEVQSMDLAVHK
ncbi:putative PLAC8 motif-containing protein [Helianthus annuus]|nr:putative PLAC8 motif-containing protein [Helianthus annuus]KAJ0529616.1 putative PLAC8 motif-containing protein [Helianthus annuus]KAJ0699950.1 putative PLAC8 motif-containing protein [Helianthus annuus]